VIAALQYAQPGSSLQYRETVGGVQLPRIHGSS